MTSANTELNSRRKKVFSKILKLCCLLGVIWACLIAASAAWGNDSVRPANPFGGILPETLPRGGMVMFPKPVACGIAKDMRENLAKDFDEKDKQTLGFTNIPPDGTGNKNMILYILKSPTGTWTVIEEHVSGTACIIASGITFDWVPRPEKKNKTNL